MGKRLAYRVQEAVHLLRANGDASLLRRLSHMPSDQGERKRVFVLEQMRAHTQIIRASFTKTNSFVILISFYAVLMLHFRSSTASMRPPYFRLSALLLT